MENVWILPLVSNKTHLLLHTLFTKSGGSYSHRHSYRIGERWFSSARRLKTWLRSRMDCERNRNLAVLNSHKQRTSLQCLFFQCSWRRTGVCSSQREPQEKLWQLQRVALRLCYLTYLIAVHNGIPSEDGYAIYIYWDCKYDGAQMYGKWRKSDP